MAGLLNGRYELGKVVGAGGMGSVHRATDTRLGRTVAVKVLRDGALADDLARSRMRSEARLASGIHHRGVAQIFDYDESSDSHPGTSFIVMEFIDGRSLADLLRESGPLPVDQVVSLIKQVADALTAAHAAGIVHRDLKPANIMLTDAGRIVLVDFGIARSAASEPLTDTGTLIGTADYFSPEQAAGRSATTQSDLYSLGVVAHHCLTGSSPFRRDHPVATAVAHLNDPLPDLDASVPVRVRDLVTRLTAKSPADRPADAAQVAAEAASIGAAAPIEVPAPTTVEPLIASATTILPTPRPARRPLAIVSGVGLVAALLVGATQLASGDDPPVPDVVGMSAADASAALSDDGMQAKRTTVDTPGTPAGEVVAQSPEPGEPRPDDEMVDVTVASGKVAVSADQIIGTEYAAAAAALEKLGFQVARTDITRSTGAGTVVSLDHSGRLPDGSTITLAVAVAPAPTAAPPTQAASTGTSSGAAKSSGQGKAKAKNKGKAKGKSN